MGGAGATLAGAASEGLYASGDAAAAGAGAAAPPPPKRASRASTKSTWNNEKCNKKTQIPTARNAAASLEGGAAAAVGCASCQHQLLYAD